MLLAMLKAIANLEASKPSTYEKKTRNHEKKRKKKEKNASNSDPLTSKSTPLPLVSPIFFLPQRQ
jgi:hypothetical protein